MKDTYKLLSACLLFLAGCKNNTENVVTDLTAGKNWPAYGGNRAGNRYSPLSQINVDNVKKLEVAWMYDAREAVDTSEKDYYPKAIQCQPCATKFKQHSELQHS